MSWIFLLLLITTLVPLGDAFSCFMCNKGDETCDEPKKNQLQDCTSVKGSIKTCVKINAQGQTIRTCGVPDVKVTACNSQAGVTVCMCEQEFCNSAISVSKKQIFAVLMGISVTLFARFGWTLWKDF